MPHLTLEYTSNIRKHAGFRCLFFSLHQALMETGEFVLDEIKSRAVAVDDFYIGNGDPEKSFVHLKIALLDHRSNTLKRVVADRCLRLLSEHFAEHLKSGSCQLCVELVDIRRDGYFKAEQ